jgi:homoserine kinase type II
VTRQSNRGGFSGARIWCIEAAGQRFCLRAWPERQSDSQHLDFIHGLMRTARSASLDFVPAVVDTTDGRGHHFLQGRLWDLTEWMPGRADFHTRPTATRLEVATRALASLHSCWRHSHGGRASICPAIQRRLAAASEWNDLRRGGWRPPDATTDLDPVRPVAERAWQTIDRLVASVPGRLRARAGRQWTLQPCLCDIWHDHLLFEGDRLTGLIDFGSAKIDHPAVDIARMFGSLVPDDDASWQVGLRAYRAVRRLSDEESDLALALDETGTIIGVATWLRWLYEERRPFEDRSAVARRLAALVGRLESARWTASLPGSGG